MQVLGSISQTLTRAAASQRVKNLKIFAGATAGLVVVLMLLLAVEYMKRGTVA
jgi:hypothetical protein